MDNFYQSWLTAQGIGAVEAGKRVFEQMAKSASTPKPDPVTVNADHWRLELHSIIQEALGYLTVSEIEEVVDDAISEALEDSVRS